jgi:choice-of-anchor A domain-containing protein
MTMMRSMRVLGVVPTLALIAASAGSAHATVLTAKEILSIYNLVTTGDVSTSSDIVGNAVVGGDLTGASFFSGGSNVPASPVLDLYGTLKNSINLNAGGNLYYNGAINPPNVVFNGGGSQHPLDAAANPLSDYTAPLTALSTQLEGLATTGGTSFINGNFNAGSNTGIVVFEVSGMDLATDLNNDDISFTGGAGVTYIINVDGNFAQPSSSHLNSLEPDALFNFYNATTVDVGTWSGASILAPDAAVSITGGGNISGSLFAAEYLGGGELHNDNLFAGQLPPSPPAVPEPSTWAMLLAGFAGLGFVGFRRARKTATA